ncbi:beta-1,3-galactosyltransferase 5 [Xenopus tropicalis]|uniref:Hexosyltransferase n=1 Tax=Xenopus tropicalis TaxID=8364 RepID=A0A8J1J4W5_XENTR|nr:beta-1,3-galactosyltransferase 5 [Xenopus tropicalis]
MGYDRKLFVIEPEGFLKNLSPLPAYYQETLKTWSMVSVLRERVIQGEDILTEPLLYNPSLKTRMLKSTSIRRRLCRAQLTRVGNLLDFERIDWVQTQEVMQRMELRTTRVPNRLIKEIKDTISSGSHTFINEVLHAVEPDSSWNAPPPAIKIAPKIRQSPQAAPSPNLSQLENFTLTRFCDMPRKLLYSLMLHTVHFLALVSRYDTIWRRIQCERNPPFLVLLVTTTHSQKEERNVIRQTWGKERLIGDKLVSTYFLLGAGTNPRLQEELTGESNTYNDIIQRDFIDTYYNLTLKTIMGIEWICTHCPQTTFVMKTDTDMFVNPLYLVELLVKKNQTTNLFTGSLKPHDAPVRDINSKWYISTTEYPLAKYPPFCSGTGYAFSVDVAQRIQNVSGSVPFFKLEDVYVGMCLEKLEINLENLHTEPTFFPYKIPFNICKYRKLVTSHGVRPRELYLFWEALRRSRAVQC